jgi:KipI family sensor histidine kinase inhibitor
LAIRFLPSGDTALVIEFGERIDRRLSERVLQENRRLRDAAITGVVETVPSYRSILVHYDPLRITGADLRRAVEPLLGGVGKTAKAGRTWRVPVCYEPQFAPDLAEVAERTGLAPERIGALHSSVPYHIYMVGFLPGYPYLGDLPEELVLPRRKDPRLRVPPGAIGIATTMTAIYTLESPGGWHLIGTTPIRAFDPSWDVPALFAPGDGVIFEPVGVETFEDIRAASAAGTYQVPMEGAA